MPITPKSLVIFDYHDLRSGADRTMQKEPHWFCQQDGCKHHTAFLTVALFHQHDEHDIPMNELDVRTAFIQRKEE